jgi:hypothetical protein
MPDLGKAVSGDLRISRRGQLADDRFVVADKGLDIVSGDEVHGNSSLCLLATGDANTGTRQPGASAHLPSCDGMAG